MFIVIDYRLLCAVTHAELTTRVSGGGIAMCALTGADLSSNTLQQPACGPFLVSLNTFLLVAGVVFPTLKRFCLGWLRNN